MSKQKVVYVAFFLIVASLLGAVALTKTVAGAVESNKCIATPGQGSYSASTTIQIECGSSIASMYYEWFDAETNVRITGYSSTFPIPIKMSTRYPAEKSLNLKLTWRDSQGAYGSSTILYGATYVCTDTDDGLNFLVKGKTNGNHEDSCINETTASGTVISNRTLAEMYCGELISGQQQTLTKYVICKNGCKDGACLDCRGNDCVNDSLNCNLDSDCAAGYKCDVYFSDNYFSNKETKGICKIPTSPYYRECKDSDDGYNASMFGTVTWRGRDGSAQTTKDLCIGTTTLMEAVCDFNGFAYNGKTTNCQNGCKDGACIQPAKPDFTISRIEIEQVGMLPDARSFTTEISVYVKNIGPQYYDANRVMAVNLHFGSADFKIDSLYPSLSGPVYSTNQEIAFKKTFSTTDYEKLVRGLTYFNAYVDSDKAIAETNEENNDFRKDISSVELNPDFLISRIEIVQVGMSSDARSSATEISVYVKNIGPQYYDANRVMAVNLHIGSADFKIDSLYPSLSRPVYSTNQEIAFKKTFSTTDYEKLVRGLTYFNAYVDSDKAIAETNEENNDFRKDISSVELNPDFLISRIEVNPADSRVKPMVNVYLKNIGDNFDNAKNILQCSLKVKGMTLFANVSSKYLKTGEEALCGFDVVRLGIYGQISVIGMADPNNAVNEVNEKNNQLAKVITMAKAPDFVVSKITTETFNATNYLVSINVKNIGGTFDNTNKYLNCRLVANDVYTYDFSTVFPISGGDDIYNANEEAICKFWFSDLNKVNSVTATVDYGNNIGELNEENNSLSKRILKGKVLGVKVVKKKLPVVKRVSAIKK